MASLWEEEREPSPSRRVVEQPKPQPVPVPVAPIAKKIKDLETEVTDLQRKNESKEQSKPFRFPFKWKMKFGQTRKKINLEKVLVMFLNKKNEIETPVFVPIYSGNIIIYKNKAYEFDPRGIWRLKGVKGYPSVYLIREIDRRPLKNPDGRLLLTKNGRTIYSKDAAVSNLDIEEVRGRGDSTESDEFLIKAALKAYTTTKPPVQVNWVVIAIVVVVIGVAAYFLLNSNSGAV